MARRRPRQRPRRTRGQMSRRSFMGGAAALIGLPFLESLVGHGKQAWAQEASAPLRHMYFYAPNGIHMPEWTPDDVGADFAPKRILQPLADQGLLDDILLLSNMANRPAEPEGPGDHAAGTGGFLTAKHVRKTEGENIENGISVDQIIAQAVGTETRLPSIQLGSEGGASVGGCDSGYSCAYSRNISWAGPQTPLPKMDNPQLVFDRFFAGFDPTATAEEIEKRRADRRSVLDYAVGEAQLMQSDLSARDRAKLDEYLTGVRELERQVEESSSARVCEPPTYPPVELDHADHVKLMLDMAVLAFQCDITRVSSYMVANAASSVSYNFIGVTGGHHDISHHQNDPDNHEKLTIIDTWEVAQLAYMLGRMKDIEEADGSTLLENAMVFFSSEISDGNRHAHHDLPILIAGQAQGQIATGRHVRFEDERPIADLYLSLLGTYGIDQAAFGDDSTGALPADVFLG